VNELKFLAIADAAEDLNPLQDVLRPFERDDQVQDNERGLRLVQNREEMNPKMESRAF
jgi:hypothetical protein